MNALHQFLRRFRSVFRKEKLDRDMAEEMRFHLEQRAADNVDDGLPPDEARYAAQRKFGGIEQIKEQAREARGYVAPLREVAFRFVSVMAQLGGYIGGLALALAAAGVYASISFSTSQRTREIGVRMALGASRGSVLALVLRGGLKVIGWGALAGLVPALIGLRLLTGLVAGGGWGVDSVAIVAVIGFFATIAAIACLVPAWRGARINPVEALRAE